MKLGWLAAAAVALLVSGTAAADADKQTKGKFDDKFRQLEVDLPSPNTYRAASGAPGESYWQQQADYVINATLDEAKKLGDGKTLSLDISTRDYIESMHNGTSCEDCHDSLDSKTHGKVKTPLASRRELSTSMQGSCVTCHKKKVKQYDDGLHAALVATHGPHAG